MVMKRLIIYRQYFGEERGGVGQIEKEFKNEGEFGLWFTAFHRRYKFRKITGIHKA